MREDSDSEIVSIIDAAEELLDPLERIAERTEDDPGVPFQPNELAALVELRRADRPAFEALRAQLKKAGCRVTALDDAIAEEAGDSKGRGPKQADILIEIAAGVDLFHTADDTGFADVEVDGHRETWPIRSRGFRAWLCRQFFLRTGGAPNSDAMQSAMGVIEARARFEAPERIAHLRVGEQEGKIYVDLCDTAWRAIEIDSVGWRIVNCPPIRFRRAAGMKALSEPVKGGSVQRLRSFLNVKAESDFVLIVAWLVAALRGKGPFPVLAVAGEQGAAKSTFCAIIRALIDPNSAPLRALPRQDEELFIAANNGHVLAFDNISGALPSWTSDTLCRLSTGGGFAKRQLYSDADETIFDACRPTLLNGIEDVVSRPDLADRSIFQVLEAIPDEARRPEAEIWQAFEAERPAILGALLDAVSKGLERLPHTKLDRLPRMADFALWASACEAALWPEGAFMEAYAGNRAIAVDGVIDADPVASAVRSFARSHSGWEGTAAELLTALEREVGEKVAKARTWPGAANALSGRLRRAAASLRKVGVEVTFDRAENRARSRTIRVTSQASDSSAEKGEKSSSPLSTSSAPLMTPSEINDLPKIGPDDPADDADDPAAKIVRNIVRSNPLKSLALDNADGADDLLRPSTAAEKRWSVKI
jgi:hypothetical protein